MVRLAGKVHYTATSLSLSLSLCFLMFFFTNYHEVWSSCFYLKISVNSVRLIRADSGLCIYHLMVRSNFNFPAQFPVDNLPHLVVSSLVLFCASFLHSLIMWLIVSSLSSHNCLLGGLWHVDALIYQTLRLITQCQTINKNIYRPGWW